LQTWRWSEFKRRHGWEPIRLEVDLEERTGLLAQILLRRAGPLSLIYVPRGPAVDPEAPEHVIQAFQVALDRYARAHRAVVALVEPEDARVGRILGAQRRWECSPIVIQPRRTIKVSIDQDDETLLGQMKSKTRYNVRLATRRGVTVRRGSRADVGSFHALLQDTSSRDQFGIHDLTYYQDLFDVYGDDACLLLAEFEGTVVAGIVVVRWGTEAAYLYGASSTNHQRHMPSYLLQFEAMRWARDRGCRLYDLWGIPDEDEPPDVVGENPEQVNVRSGMWGVYRFKQGFGGQIVDYPAVYQRVYIPLIFRLWRRTRMASL
jgi:lipid II:glycine glycyltransferase (peptidoglycan interpeptide bridge formation enzyme)